MQLNSVVPAPFETENGAPLADRERDAVRGEAPHNRVTPRS